MKHKSSNMKNALELANNSFANVLNTIEAKNMNPNDVTSLSISTKVIFGRQSKDYENPNLVPKMAVTNVKVGITFQGIDTNY
jgi:hypothetical protein